MRMLIGFLILALSAAPTWSQTAVPFESLVEIRTKIPANARLADVLGRERAGAGVVIDATGLVLTVGYIMMEADETTVLFPDGRALPAQYVAYDHETGFGLVRTLAPPDVTPAELGSSAPVKTGDTLIYASFLDQPIVETVTVASRRSFGGYWEYLLDDALFTTPAMPNFAGAALFNRSGELVGIGSLYAADAGERTDQGGAPQPGNMAIPIDALSPVFADLLTDGRRRAEITPWTGLILNDAQGFLIAVATSDDGPAQAAGLRRGDIILRLDGEPVRTIMDYMRILRAGGPPGDDVRIDYFRPQTGERTATVTTVDRLDWLRLNPSY